MHLKSSPSYQKGEINVKDLAYGKYSFVEKASPNGYFLVTEPIVFELKEHGKTIELLAVNHLIKGDLEITKADVANGNNKLPNAEFNIHNEAGKEVVKGTTDNKGIAKFKEVKPEQPQPEQSYPDKNTPTSEQPKEQVKTNRLT